MSTNNKIVHILALFCVLFFSIIAYLTYFQLFTADSLKKHPNNPRLIKSENKILRGSIIDKSGVVLAKSTRIDKNTQKRQYIFGNLYCHIIGYNSTKYGKNQLESEYDNDLLGKSYSGTINEIKKAFSGGESIGYNLQLTIDHKLQKVASDSLSNVHGSVVAIDPKTGKILAMVSNPGFNPNDLENEFKKLKKSQDGNFTSRSTANSYAPGSTFKTLTSIAAFENNYDNFTFDDQGSTDIDGKLIKNYGSHVYGNLDIKKALEVSSNVYFSKLGLKIGSKGLLDVENKAYLNKKLKFDIPLKKSTLDENKLLSSKTELGAVSIGQGTLQVTPLEVAMISAAIANDGKMMQPYLVDNIQSSKGKIIKQIEPKELSELTTPDIANKLTDMMVNVVENGTGRSSRVSGISIAGKTGTAENEVVGKEHAWFMAFAPAEDPKIAIAIIDEYSGLTGGEVCAPIAKKLFSTYINGQ